MKTIKVVTLGWTKWQNMPKSLKDKFIELGVAGYKGFTGKYHYNFQDKNDDKKIISLIQLWKPFFFLKVKGKYFWEIYAQNNPKLFKDVEQFKTKKEAMERIKGLLD